MMRALVIVGLLAACGDNLDPPVVPLPSGPAQLAFDGDALVFTRGSQTLLTFHAGAFQVGTVDDLDSGASFDPYWLFTTPPNEPDGLAWHASDKLHVIASDALALKLAFDVPGGEATLRFTPGQSGSFSAT